MPITHTCGATWGGLKTEHCASCHLTFSSTAVGDAHRVGEHGVKTGPDRRRCLTPEEFQALVFGDPPMPRFEARLNRYGTIVWGRPGQNPLSLLTHEKSEGLTGAPACDGPGAQSQALESWLSA